MPTVTSYRNGSTAGMAGHNPNPSKRGKVSGWSAAAVRRHTKWLYSVDTEELDGYGFALTLTMLDTPATAKEFHALRKAWLRRTDRMGAVRVHWVIEWQERGTPHLHVAVYFRDFDSLPAGFRKSAVMGPMLLGAWRELATRYRAGSKGQHWASIDGPLGWLKYLSKHASRGVKHYQRAGHPEGWDSTGRLWGHGGEWPSEAPGRYSMSREAFWRYRRLVRAWRVSNARLSGNVARISYARKMLACPQRKLSAVRGVSDWVPESVTLALIGLLISEGYDVVELSSSADS